MAAGTVISIDGMGGDLGPAPLIAGMARAARQDETLRFLVHGDETVLKPQISRRAILRDRCEIRHAAGVVSMDEKPSRAVRTGRETSLWNAIDAVRKGEARVALSSGNTGALVAMSILQLRTAPGVHRPAIAVHWPAKNPHGFNVVLDMGADIRADAATLLQYAIMGAEYSRLAFGIAEPRVALLNVGSEEMKGRQTLHEARELIANAATTGDLGLRPIGYAEGNDILTDKVDVIVTDGFTGNIALKAAEGTAKFIRDALKNAFSHSIWSRLGALFALTSLRRLRQRIDPRRVNGGVLLGLNGAVVKSHGSADAVGFASAIHLAAKMTAQDFPNLVAERLASLDLTALASAPKSGRGQSDA